MQTEDKTALLEAVTRYRPVDEFFDRAYVDIDERRETPVPHRYIHGGFEGTATRFSFYFPDTYEGRFFHFLEGGYGGNENTVAVGGSQFGGMAFAASRGGFFVESNQGHIGAELCPKGGNDATIYGYRASAECARFARYLAGAVYDRSPTHGYLFGGSGGGHRTLLAMEYVEDDDVWDGGVASVIGAPNTLRAYSAMNNARRLIGPLFEGVIDATEPGGSGNPFEHLDTEQREALAHLYGEGFPRRAERSVQDGLNAGVAFWTWNADGLRDVHGDYFDAFWKERGHAGADGLLKRWTIETTTSVAKTVTPDEAVGYPLSGFGRLLMTAPSGKRVGVLLVDDLPRWAEGARITILSGAAAGRVLYCSQYANGLIIGSSIGEAQTLLFDGVEIGDRIHVDNRDFLAYCYYYRHHISASPSPKLSVDGQPIYPQYDDPPMSSSPVFGTVPRHDHIRRPTFLLQHTLDTSGWPAGAVECEARVREYLGDRFDEQFRLWWIENAEHIAGSLVPARSIPAPSTRLIDYAGAHEAALDAMVALVERGTRPPSSTGYLFDPYECAVRLTATAAERGGFQPVVRATANGSVRADVRAGEEVVLGVEATVPDGVGSIIEVAWDFEGDASWSELHRPEDSLSTVRQETRHTFERPGTYFPSARVVAHGAGDGGDTFARVMNLGRCRVEVE